MPFHYHTLCRDAVECDLIFDGLIAMENTLKPETTPVITTLSEAAIRTVMITGMEGVGWGGVGGILSKCDIPTLISTPPPTLIRGWGMGWG